MKCDERFRGDVLLRLFDSLTSSGADWIRVGLLLEYAAELVGKVAVLEAGHTVLDGPGQHLFALIGCLIEID